MALIIAGPFFCLILIENLQITRIYKKLDLKINQVGGEPYTFRLGLVTNYPRGFGLLLD